MDYMADNSPGSTGAKPQENGFRRAGTQQRAQQNPVNRMGTGGSSSDGRASAFQAECREFDSRLPLHYKRVDWYSKMLGRPLGGNGYLAHVAQSVERFLGKEEVHRFNSGRGLHFLVFQDAGKDSKQRFGKKDLRQAMHLLRSLAEISA
jgi:hypothetical protein